MTDWVLGGLVVTYVIVAVLLLSLNLLSRWAWWVKTGAIVITSGFFAGSYVFAHSLLGWPTDDGLPARFELLWAEVVEPDKYLGTPGAIYLWVSLLDDFNIAIGKPRAHELSYSDELAMKVESAVSRVLEGVEIVGTAEVLEEQEPVDSDAADLVDPDADLVSGHFDVETFPDDGMAIEFQDLPPPVLPEKELL